MTATEYRPFIRRGMDREIILRARSGDHDAFEAVARDAVARLYGTARLILLREDLAQDAARDALTVAWRQIGGLKDPDAFGPWLLGILVRSCQAITRKDGRRTVGDIGAGDAATDRADSEQAFGR